MTLVPFERRTRRRLVIVLVLVSLALLALVRAVVSPDSDPVPAADRTRPGTLTVHGPARIDVGSPWTLMVGGATDATIVAEVHGAWGVRQLELQVESDSVTLPGDLTQHRGRLSAYLTSGAVVAHVTVEVLADRAVDGIVPLAGPRSIVADGADWTMVTAIPVDRYGNSIADGSPVRLYVRRPDGTTEIVETLAADLLAGVRVYAGTVAGRTTIRVATDDSTGPEVEVLEVPGPPASVRLLDVEAPLRADGRMLVEMTSAPLLDRFGNQLLDGTAASVTVDGPDGTGVQTAVTIDGRVEFVIEAPTRPGSVEVHAVVDGVQSPPVVLDLASDVVDIPVEVERRSAADSSAVTVVVGPVLTRLGGFVADGTDVTLRVGGESIVDSLRDGVAAFDVVARPDDVLTIDVLGARVTAVAP